MRDKVVCERCVWQIRCVWKIVCDQVVCVRVKVVCVTKFQSRRTQSESEHAVWWPLASHLTQPEHIAHCFVLASSSTPGQRGDRRHHVGLLGTGTHAQWRTTKRCKVKATTLPRLSQVPRLPRKTKVDVAKCHTCTCTAKCRGARPSAPPEPAQCHISTTPATEREGGCLKVPRLPRKTKVNVTKVDACHVKRRWMSPSTAPATQSAAASRATNSDQARHQTQPSARSTAPATSNEGACRQVRTWNDGCRQGARLPRKVPRQNGRLTAANSDQARHQTQPSARSATPATPNESGCPQVPHLPRETKVDVAKCHACPAASQATNGDQARHQTQPSARSATPATPNESGCPQVPHLSRKVPRRHGRLTATISAPPDPAQRHKRHTCHAKRKLDAPKRHACHVKRRWMSPGATPATQSAAASRKRATSPVPQVARVPRKTKVDVRCATPATWNEDGCRQVASLPQSHGRLTATKRATRPIPVPEVPPVPQAPRLPRQTQVDVAKRHACHVKRRWMSSSATPATQNEDGCEQAGWWCVTKLCVCVSMLCASKLGVTMLCVTMLCVKDGVWKRVCDKAVCERWCVTKLCVCDQVVCDKVVCVWQSGVWQSCVCERWCVTKLCVKDSVWQSCVWKMVCEMVVDKVVCERWCVTKLCVIDGVWQSCVCVTVGAQLCVRDVWEMVHSCVWEMVCDKVVCER